MQVLLVTYTAADALSPQMPPEFDVLREQHDKLMEGLEAVEVAQILFSKKIFSTICFETITSMKIRPEQVGKLLGYLRSCEDIKGAFSAFCDALSSIKALEWIAQLLQKGNTFI